MTKKFILPIVVTGLVVVVAVVGILQFQKSQKPKESNALIVGAERSILSAPVYIAENQGYFEEEGLEVEIQDFPTGRASFLAMLEKAVPDISTVAPTPIMFQSFHRQDFSVLASFVSSWTDVKVIARQDKGIKTGADFKGKKICTPKGTTGQYVLSAYLAKNNLKDSDVELVDTKPDGIAAAIETHHCQAAIIWEPYASRTLKVLGGKGAYLPTPDLYNETFNFTVLNNFIQTRPQTLIKFLKAIEKAELFIKENKELSQTIVATRLGIDRKTVSELWQEFSFELSLNQFLINTLEDEARWAIANKLTAETTVPNYRDFIYSSALKVVKPETVNVQ